MQKSSHGYIKLDHNLILNTKETCTLKSQNKSKMKSAQIAFLRSFMGAKRRERRNISEQRFRSNKQNTYLECTLQMKYKNYLFYNKDNHAEQGRTSSGHNV